MSGVVANYLKQRWSISNSEAYWVTSEPFFAMVWHFLNLVPMPKDLASMINWFTFEWIYLYSFTVSLISRLNGWLRKPIKGLPFLVRVELSSLSLVGEAALQPVRRASGVIAVWSNITEFALSHTESERVLAQILNKNVEVYRREINRKGRELEQKGKRWSITAEHSSIILFST